MKIRVTMDSGKEYISEKDSTVKELVQRVNPKTGMEVNYISLDNNKKVYINGSRISSIEVIE